MVPTGQHPVPEHKALCHLRPSLALELSFLHTDLQSLLKIGSSQNLSDFHALHKLCPVYVIPSAFTYLVKIDTFPDLVTASPIRNSPLSFSPCTSCYSNCYPLVLFHVCLSPLKCKFLQAGNHLYAVPLLKEEKNYMLNHSFQLF